MYRGVFYFLEYELCDAVTCAHVEWCGVVVEQHYTDISCVVGVDDSGVYIEHGFECKA